jgi:hypothetical protein
VIGRFNPAGVVTLLHSLAAALIDQAGKPNQ